MSQSRQIKRLADYQPPAFFTQSIDLEFVLDPVATQVTAVSQFKLDQLQDIVGTSLSNLNRHTTGKIESLSQELRIAGVQRLGPETVVLQ